MEKNTRRSFLLQSLKGAVVTTLSWTGIQQLAIAGNNDDAIKSNHNCFVQQPLPYTFDALEDIIDAKTIAAITRCLWR